MDYLYLTGWELHHSAYLFTFHLAGGHGTEKSKDPISVLDYYQLPVQARVIFSSAKPEDRILGVS